MPRLKRPVTNAHENLAVAPSDSLTATQHFTIVSATATTTRVVP